MKSLQEEIITEDLRRILSGRSEANTKNSSESL
jgi:hypothetical protein